jgi:hypothetical protein
MYKLIFPLFAFLLVMALASCGLNPAPAQDDTSRDGDNGDDSDDARRELPRYITMRLADYGEYENDTIGIGFGVGNISRALTYDNAQEAHDFFEVVFYHPGSNTVARTAWSIGETPELRGVWRTGAGVNYGGVDVSNSTAAGCAMLFAGTKEDKTLLAVGRLVEVDGVPGTTINLGTVSVTFEVTALKAGVSYNAAQSSFWTSYGSSTPNQISGVEAGSTEIENGVYINNNGKKTFPLFKLKKTSDNVMWGTYNFTVDSVAPSAAQPDFNQYAAGIVLAGGWKVETRNTNSSILAQDTKTRVELEGRNNVNVQTGYDPKTAPQFFLNPVQFRFDTSALAEEDDGSVFALVFEIFVYNLSPLPAASNGPDAVKWRISTGSGTKWLDLDDGSGGDGGAIFLGTGNVKARLE